MRRLRRASRAVAAQAALAIVVLVLPAAAISFATTTQSDTVLGKSVAGVSSKYSSPDYKQVSRFTTTTARSVTALSAHVAGRGTIGAHTVTAVIYGDSSGQPAALIGASTAVTIPAATPAAWVEFPFDTTVELPPGSYWLGLHAGPQTGDALAYYYFDTAAAAQRTKSDAFSNGASAEFGAGTIQDREMSIFAVTASSSPVNVVPPAVAGEPYEGQTLTASSGSWTGAEPIGYDLGWERCDAAGQACAAIAGASAQTHLLEAADVGSTLRVTVTASNAAGAERAQSPPTSVVAQPVVDGLTQVGDPLTGSSDPTYYAGNHRVAVTARGRVLVVHGRHATGVQLAWRDGAGGWRTTTRGAVTDGLLLRGTSTGDWPASIAVARDSSGAEHAWVVWSRATGGPSRPVQLLRLSDLDHPDGPSVGAVVTVDAAALGSIRADLGFERATDGSTRGCIVWTRRLEDSTWELVATWFGVDADEPTFHDTTVIHSTTASGRTGTVVPASAGIRIVARAKSGRLQVYGHEAGQPLTQWWAGMLGVATASTAPGAAALDSGEIIAAVESDTTAHIVTVQSFAAPAAAPQTMLELGGYAMPSIASDGVNAWLVMIRQSDGFVVSRSFAPGTGWSAEDRIEIGAEGGGNHAWPNLMREVDGRLRFVVQGPSGASFRSAVLAYQRPT